MRVLGRLADLERRERNPGEVMLGDVLARWTLLGNAEWLCDGVRRREPFLQVSRAEAGTVLAWEIARLRELGYVRCGPLWIPLAFDDAALYRSVLRWLAAHLLAQPACGEAVYVPKARDDLEPLLALWPHVLLVPTPATLSIDDMVSARAWPVHPVGLVDGPVWADGRACSPAELFFHDVDHARFKVRADLAARGIAIPDAYVDGSTLDTALGRHRSIMAAAAPHVESATWRTAPARAALLARWRAELADAPRVRAEAVRWLLFELVHEKSLPLAPDVLAIELAHDGHVRKLRDKCNAGFYADVTPRADVLHELDDARAWLAARCREHG